jgi:hypothetical protein
MQTLIEYGTWPSAIVIIAIFALCMFRAPITAVLYRTKKIGAGSKAIDFSDPPTTELQQIQPQATGQITDNPLVPTFLRA